MDLKVYGDGNYVLWMVDDATRLIRGEAIKSKDPDTIIAAMERIWINGYGMGPGMPEKYIFTDNGGEFLNEKMLNLCQEAGIKLKSTGSYSPQQNSVNERNHGVTDIMVEKYRREDPNLTLQDAINKAAFAKNSLIHSQTGFSPFQLVFGRNPALQMTSESTTGGLENLSGNEMARSILYKQEQARIAMEIAENEMRLKIAARDRLPANTKYIYEI
jgi:transposase InsO family protein